MSTWNRPSPLASRPIRQGWNDDFFSDQVYDPLNVQQVMNSFLENAMAPGRINVNDLSSITAPTVTMDVTEHEKNYIIHAELPGDITFTRLIQIP